MPACPHCHIFKGLWSPLNEKDGVYFCKINATHKFTRDKSGDFHSVCTTK